MVGGISLTEIPGKMKQFYDEAKKYSPAVKGVLRSKNMERFGPKTAETAKKIAEYMEMVGLGYCKDVAVELHGKGFSGTVEAFAKAAKKVYDFIKEHKTTIHAILELPQLNAASNGNAKKVSDVLKMVGLGYMKDGEEYSSESDEESGSKKEGMGFIEGGANGHAKADAALKLGTGIKLSPSVLKTLSKSQISSIDPDPLGVGKKIKKSIKKSLAHPAMNGMPAMTDAQMRKLMGKGRKKSAPKSKVPLPMLLAPKIEKDSIRGYKDYYADAEDKSGIDTLTKMLKKARKGKGATYMSGGPSTQHDLSELEPMGEKMGSGDAYKQWLAKKMGSGKIEAVKTRAGLDDLMEMVRKNDRVKGTPLYSGEGKGKKAPSARNLIVKKIMKEKGLSLPQASKYVKEHGLY
jgi:hypothetical protein